MTTFTHIIFATQEQAEAAQEAVFNRLKAHVDFAEGTVRYEDVIQCQEGWGFVNPRTSMFKDHAGFALAGFEDNEMNATIIQGD